MDHGKRADMIVHTEEPYNAEAPRTALASLPLTPLDSFYCRNHGVIGAIDPAAWTVRVVGLVARELEFDLAQLKGDFTEHTLVATLQCAGNRRKGLLDVLPIPNETPWGSAATSTAEWTGARLCDVLDAAELLPEAAHVEFLGPDIAENARPPQRYGSSIPAEKAGADEVLLAWSMNGRPLMREHGAPVRVVVPGYVGARSVKWVEQIRALTTESDNYFQAVAYRLPSLDEGERDVALGPLIVNCDVLSPDDGDRLPSGITAVSGYAIAGEGARIARVEVSVDAGRSWAQAALGKAPGPWAWQHWQITVDLPTGSVEIIARAWDSAGRTQPESAADLWNPKGYANNSWARVRVTGMRG